MESITKLCTDFVGPRFWPGLVFIGDCALYLLSIIYKSLF